METCYLNNYNAPGPLLTASGLMTDAGKQEKREAYWEGKEGGRETMSLQYSAFDLTNEALINLTTFMFRRYICHLQCYIF